MHSSQQLEISQSSKYRFAKAQRSGELPAFVEFKKEYQHFLSQQRIMALKKIYMHGIMGRNFHQQSIMVDRIGSIKLSQLSKVVEDQELIAYINQRMLQLSENILKEKQQVIWIIDLTGKIMQLASKRIYSIIQRICYNLHKYFPQMLYKLYFVNTPMLFDTIWNKISQHLDPKTQEKIGFLTDELEQLYVEVDSTLLPEFLGGDKPDSLLMGLEEQKLEENNSESEEQEIDYNSLKQALNGLKLVGGNIGQSVAQTPLNTQADDVKE